LVQGLVVLLGLATVVGGTGLSSAIADTSGAAVPGPASSVLEDAVEQARDVGHGNRYLPLAIGLVGLVGTATIAMGQMERGLNRIYGVERDRATVAKYRRALVLALTAGPLFGIAFVLAGLGRGASDGWEGDLRAAALVVRWPVALALIALALAVLLRFAPNRRQPARAWLAFGSTVAVALWVLATIALAVTFGLASTFPRTYGPLAGVVALLLWTYVSTLAILYGVAVAAQLEAVRATANAERAFVERPSLARALVPR
ncbi:MAG: YihY/virulence factor BrkB family protein, partial [Gaiella sp.]